MKQNYQTKKSAISLWLICVVTLTVMLTPNVNGQSIASYSFAQSSGTYQQAGSGAYLAAPNSGLHDDGNYSAVTLPFTFNYHSVSYTTIGISDNGYAKLGGTTSTTYSNVFGVQTDILAPFSQDLYGNTASGTVGASLSYVTTGPVGSRVFTVQWTNWGFYSSALNEQSFQLKLFEGTNTVQFVYGPSPGTSNTSVYVGMSGASTADLNVRTTTTDWTATTAGGNGSSCSFNTSVKPPSGLTYTFTSAASVAAMAFASSTSIYVPVIGGTSVNLTTGGCNDDNGYGAQTIPFTFNYHGTSFTTAGVSANGYITLGAATSNAYSNSFGTYANTLSPLSNDLYGCATGREVSVTTIGVSPSRIFVVQWENFGIYSSGLNEFSFQVKLIEGSNYVQFCYGPSPGTGSTSAYVGLSGATTADFQGRTTGTDWTATTAGGTPSSSICTVSSAVRPTNGLIFTWSPPTTPPPTVTSFTNGSQCSSSFAPIVITGTDFVGASAVKINGINVSSFTVNNPTTITATPAPGTTSGTVSVTTAVGTGTSVGVFTVSNPVSFSSVTATPPSVCVGGSSSLAVAGTIPGQIVYHVGAGNIINGFSNCGNGPYTCSGTVGFSWVDAGPSAPISISMQWGQGVECSGVGFSHTTTLNGVATPNFTTTVSNCNCAYTLPPIMSLNPATTGYIVGGTNTFLVTGLPTCYGFQNLGALGNDFATITVTYATPVSPSIFTWSPSTNLSATTGSPVTASNITTNTVYTVSAVNGVCNTTATVSILAGVPLVCNPITSTLACENVNYTLTAGATGGGQPYTYLWNNGTTNSTYTIARPVGVYNYVVTITDNCAQSCTASIDVNVTAFPVLGLTPSTGICLGSPATLTATGGASYTWAPGTGLSATTGSSVSANPSSNTIYVVTANNGSGCTVTGSVGITVSPIPSVSVSSNVPTVCLGDSAQLSAVGPPPTIAGYAFTQSINTYVPLVGATVVSQSPTFDDDASYGPFALGFTFNYHGTPMTTIGLQDNCSVALNASATSSYGGILAAQANAIAVMNADMLGNSSTHQLRYMTTGGAGNHVFTVEWYNWGKYGTGLNEINIQLRLYEATGAVEIQYQPVTPSSTFGCEVGLNGATVADFNNRTTTTNWSATTAGASNTATCQFSSSVFPVNGLTFTWTPPPTVNYSWSPSAGLSATNISNPKASPPVGTTIYTVTATAIGSGCTNTATVSIANLGAGDVAPTTTNATACAGEIDHLSASGVSTLQWYTAQIGGVLKHIGTNWDSVWTASTTYWVESFNGQCPSQRTMTTVTVLPLPLVNAGVDVGICPGDSAQIGGSAISGGAVYYMRYSGGEPWGSTSNTTEMNAAFGSGNWTLSTYESGSPAPGVLFSNATKVVFMDGSDQSATALNNYLIANLGTIQNWVSSGGHLFLNAAPNLGSNINFGFGGVTCNYPVFTGTATVTSGQTGHPIFNGPFLPVGTSWTGGSFGHATITGGGTTALVDGSGNPVVTELSYGAGRVIFGGMTMTSFHSPQPQADNLRSNILAYLNTGFSSGGYVWSPTSGLSSTNISNPKASPSITTSYTVTMTSALNGCTASDIVLVTVNPAPPTPSINGNTTLCGCGTTTLTATANGVGTTLRWYDAATGGNLLGTGSPFLSPYFCGAKTFYVEEYDPNSGCRSVVRASILVTPIAAPTVSAGSDALLCDGSGPAALAASSSNPNYDYSWLPATGLNQTTGSSVTAGPASTTTYIVTGTDNGTGCVNTDTVKVSVGVTPVIASVTASPNNFCAGNSTTLNATLAGGGGGSAYVLSSIPYAAVSPAGPTLAGPVGDDNLSGSIPIGFNFNFYGTVYSNIVISTNGFISFDPSPGSGCCSGQLLPNASAPNNVIALDWMDLNTNNGGNIDYFSLTAPNRFVVRYNSVATFSSSGTVSGEIILYQSGIIEIHNTSITTGGFNQTQGIENGLGTLAIPVTGRNSTAWNATSDAWRFAVPPAANFAWSPSGSLSSSTGYNPVATPASSTEYTVVASDAAGCSVSATVSVIVSPIPAAPTTTNGTVCGLGNVSLSALGSGGTLNWLKNVGGPIVNTGGSYNPLIGQTTTYYVFESPATTSGSVGLSSSAPGVYFNTALTIFYLEFNVLNANGIIINSVDVVPAFSSPLGSPLEIQLENSAGTVLGKFSTVTTTQGAVQTVLVNFFVPGGTGYRLRPSQNPNMQFHASGVTYPYSISDQVSITGPSPNAVGLYPFFYNWQISTGCFGPLASVVGTSTPAPPLSLASSPDSIICGAGTRTLTASGPGYVNYSWTPNDGSLSSTTGSVVIATPLATTTYVVYGSDGVPFGCADTQTVTVQVSNGPYMSVAPAPYDTLCLGYNFTMNAAAGSSTLKQLGYDENPAQTTPFLFSQLNSSVRNQFLYTATELNAAGLFGPTNISSAAFQVASKASTGPYTNFEVKMGSAGAPPLTNAYLNPSFTSCYLGNYTTSLGWNTISFTTAYPWDGVSNILIDVCYSNAITSDNDNVYYTPTADARYIEANLIGCGSTTGGAMVNRPNIRFAGGTVFYSWSPASELSSTTVEDPTYLSTSVGNKSYTLTVTDPATGCTGTASLSFVVSTQPKIPQVTAISDSLFCLTGIPVLRAYGTTGSFQWQSSTDGVNFADISGETNDTLTLAAITSTHYYRVYVYCGDSSYSRILTMVVNDPQVASTLGATICGIGTVCLQATPNNPNYDIKWYSAATGGTPLGIGNSYCTTISSTTTFYAEASVSGSSSLLTGLGNTGIPPDNSGWTAERGIVFDATSQFTLVSAQYYSSNVNVTNSVNVVLQNSAGTPLLTTSLSIPQGGTPGFYTMNLNWTIPVGTGYRLLASFGQTVQRDFAADYSSSAYNNLGPVGLITSGYDFGISSTTYNYFHNISIIGAGCLSTRVPVVGISTPPPAVNASVTQTICEGESGVISASSSDLDYIYTWEPGTLTGATQTVSPLTTTTYTVTANDPLTGCINVTTTTVNVTPRPTISSISASPAIICGVDSSQINVVSNIGGGGTGFNGGYAPGTWATQHSSGDVGYVSSFNSTDLVMVSSDGGSGATDIDVIHTMTSAGNVTFNWNYTTVDGAPYDQPQYYLNGSRFFVPGFSTGGGSAQSGTATIPVLNGDVFGFNMHSADNVFGPATCTYNNVVFPGVAGTYSWLPTLGLSSSTIKDPKASPGVTTTYTVTVTSTASGCTNTATVVVGVTATPAPNIVEPDTAVCGNSPGFYLHVVDTGAFAGGYPPGTYFEWINYTPATLGLDSILVNSTDDYRVVVTLPGLVFGSCNDTSDVMHADFTGSQAPVPLMTQDTVLCKGGSTGNAMVHLIVGGNPLVNYKWYNSSNALLRNVTTSFVDDTLKNIPAGDYRVVVTNNVGTTVLNCGEIGEIVVVEPNELAVTENIGNHVDNDCFEGALGHIDIDVTGGTTLYNYSWSNGNTTQDLSNALTGTYTVLITDYHGCSTSISSIIISPAQLTVSCSSTNISCNSSNNGTGSVVASGGTAPYGYLWDNGSTDASANGLGVGVFCVTVTDAHNCTAVCCVTITQPNVLVINPTVNMVSCKNAHDGSISLAPTGGTGPYQYLWNNFSTSPLRTGLFPGVYSVTVTDAHGCTAFGTYTIVQSATQLAANVVKTNVKCGGKCTGVATGNPTGGTGPYKYLWNNGSTTSQITGLCAGSYTLTVTDAYNCVRVQPFVITQNPTLVLTAVPSGVTQATASVSGGVAPYTYFWSTVPPQTNATATGLSPGSTYKIRVTDSKGCSKTNTVFMPLPKQLNEISLGDGMSVNVYPNPTTGLITLSFNTTETFKYTVRMYDVTGREVYLREAVNEIGKMSSTYDISTMPKGVYQLSMQSDKGSAVIKVVLQ